MRSTTGGRFRIAFIGGMVALAGCRAGKAPYRHEIRAHETIAVYDSSLNRLVHFGPRRLAPIPGVNLLHTQNLDAPVESGDGHVFRGGVYSWVAPQSGWTDAAGQTRPWPPDSELDHGPTHVSRIWIEGLEARGPVGANGLWEEKAFELVGEGVMKVRHVIGNASDKPVRAAVWSIAAAPPSSILAVPAPSHGSIRLDRPEAPALWDRITKRKGDWIKIRTKRTHWWAEEGGELKAYIPARPVVATWWKKNWFVRIGEPFDAAGTLWDAGEAPVETYLNFGDTRYESALLGPIVELQPGETTTFEETWLIVYSALPYVSTLDRALARYDAGELSFGDIEPDESEVRDAAAERTWWDESGEPHEPLAEPRRETDAAGKPRIDAMERTGVGAAQDSTSPPAPESEPPLLDLEDPEDRPATPVRPVEPGEGGHD